MSPMLRRVAFVVSILSLAACTADPDAIRRAITQHPEIIFDAIEKNSGKFAEVMGRVQKEARRIAMEKAQQEQAAQLAEDLKSPRRAKLDEDRAVRGSRQAPVVLVVYSDFECPYCRRGYETVEEFRQKLGAKLLVVYKHLPLEFHPMAMPSAKRFEAIALQSAEKAYAFHDEVFRNQDKLHQGGEKFLDDCVRKVGADLARVKRDMESDKVAKRIASDTAEAHSFGMTGTPGFLLNGVSIKGAVPIAQFNEILARRPTYAGATVEDSRAPSGK